jgi:hypothetical protein
MKNQEEEEKLSKIKMVVAAPPFDIAMNLFTTFRSIATFGISAAPFATGLGISRIVAQRKLAKNIIAKKSLKNLKKMKN